jgi:2-(3-amino-3-carboxypropyl)histidine synthase
MTADFLAALQPGLDRACATIRKRKARLVGIALPDGLRIHFRELSGSVESRSGAKAAMLVEMCCGACMAEVQPGFDFILHVAHDRLRPPKESCGPKGRPSSKSQSRILFIPYKPAMDVERCLRAAIPLLSSPVGILTTSTHADELSEVKKILKRSGMEPLTAPGNRTGRMAVVLGCDFSAARKIVKKVSSFLFVGSGAFHPVGVGIATGKPVIGADPYDGQVRTFSEEMDRILRRRFASIELARGAKVFGIMLGLYPGQMRKDRAISIKTILEREGKEAHLLAARRFDPEMVAHLGLEAIVSTGCSRIALDDSARYPIPVLSPPELEIVLGKRKWEEYRLDEIG